MRFVYLSIVGVTAIVLAVLVILYRLPDNGNEDDHEETVIYGGPLNLGVGYAALGKVGLFYIGALVAFILALEVVFGLLFPLPSLGLIATAPASVFETRSAVNFAAPT